MSRTVPVAAARRELKACSACWGSMLRSLSSLRPTGPCCKIPLVACLFL